jgi:hypothetical protein
VRLDGCLVALYMKSRCFDALEPKSRCLDNL